MPERALGLAAGELDRLHRDRVGALDDIELADVVSFATAVASLQCARQGSSPPTLAEVDAYFHSRSTP
jgi:sugar/nucleoside kinase (ribokinase family)